MTGGRICFNTLDNSSILLKYYGSLSKLKDKIEMTNEVAELFELASGDYRYGSKAASVQEGEQEEPREWSLDKNGVIVSKPIPTNQSQVFKCGTHDYETKSLTEFNQHIESHSNNSKAASTPAALVNPVREIFDFLNARHY